MKLAPKKREESSATLAPTLWVVAGFSLIFALAASASDPSWWSARGAVHAPVVTTNDGIVTTNYVTNAYAVVTQGQLKQFTARAVDELNAHFSTFGGPGPALTNLVYGWQQDYATNGYATNTANPSRPYKPSDFTAMTVGQLKYIGNLIWGRLAAGGYTNAVPSWLAQNTNTDNVAANLGQLKEIFDFDLTLDSDGNGLPDWWEYAYFGQIGNDPTSSPDNNGFTLLQDYEQGINPTNYYSQPGGTITPTLAVAGGNNQTAPQATFLSAPLAVTVTRSGGGALTNAPVTFTTAGGTGYFSTSPGGTANATLTVNADATGTAQVYYAGPDVASATNSIQVMAGSATNTFTEMTDIDDGSIAGPSGLMIAGGSVLGQVVLSWSNNATNSSSTLIQQSTDYLTWVTIATNAPSATTYTVNEADPSKKYYFGVISEGP